ncbi:MAG: prepilin-type N-terminal cleavage/methylation domain-containing protein [Desulfobacterales bacterium]|nr:prepilin-type N-terminal cleavage/methylation domain-containing protein [Desulfobacterales bacterium]
MLKKLKGNKKGFTLIELMIVIAIIGILAAIAIPNFLRYQLKSKTAEAKTNIGAIRTAQVAFCAENDVFLGAASNPGGNALSTKVAWVITAGVGFDAVGFAPAGNVYYRYGVLAAAVAAQPGPALTASGANAALAAGTPNVNGTIQIQINAMGDLDGDLAAAGWCQTEETTAIVDLAPGLY